jgi:putative serine protease PepD
MPARFLKRRLLIAGAVLLLILGALIDRVVTLSTSSSNPVAAATATTATPTVRFTNSASAASIDQATEHAYRVASPSVVYVVSEGVGTGSGVIYDNRGDIVTNNHVVSGATAISVTLSNGKSYSATLIGTDQSDDLAVIRIHASGLTPAQFATAGSYTVAQTVLAIGSPLGLKQSVTSGLVSGLHRAEQEPNGSYIADAVQTSAPINPGNSGGALVTLDGTVVGIPTLEQTGTTSGSAAQDIGFAIPSERVTLVANQIIANGKVLHTGRAYLGIAPTDASAQANQFGGGQGIVNGALVSQLASGGPADQAGIQQGDVITQADGKTVTDAQDLLTILAAKKPGESISLTINRNGSTSNVTAKLGELPA